MERTILRSELRSASGTPPPASDDEALQRLRNLSSLQYAVQDTVMPDAPDATAQDEDDELAFNLFAPTTSTTNAKPSTSDAATTAQKIRLRSPSVDLADATFVQPYRDRGYYFTATSAQEKADFEASALSPSQILSLSQTPWPGSTYPWKVLHIPSSSLSRPQRLQLTQHAPSGFSKLGQLEPPRKRRRLGKKARIAVRVKCRVEEAKREQAMKSKGVKEAEEREKRTRRNREKKVKRKAKEKAKKAEGGVGGEGDGEGNESGGD